MPTERTTTVSDTKGGLLLAFAKQHLPKKTAEIEAIHREDYSKKNTRLDERIAGLKKQAKADAKAKKEEQSVKAENMAKTDEKTAEKVKKATAPTVPTTVPALLLKGKTVEVATAV